MCDSFPIPPSVTDVKAYHEGRIGGLNYDEPPCHNWLKDRGHGPLAALNWMIGFRDEKVAQGWSELIDWRGTECRCGKGCL